MEALWFSRTLMFTSRDGVMCRKTCIFINTAVINSYRGGTLYFVLITPPPHTHTHTRTHILGSPVEIQTPAHRNLISSNMATSPLVLSPSSILPPLSSRCAFISARKISARNLKMSLFLKNVCLKLRNQKLRKSGSVSSDLKYRPVQR